MIAQWPRFATECQFQGKSYSKSELKNFASNLTILNQYFPEMKFAFQYSINSSILCCSIIVFLTFIIGLPQQKPTKVMKIWQFNMRNF